MKKSTLTIVVLVTIILLFIFATAKLPTDPDSLTPATFQTYTEEKHQAAPRN